MPVDNTACILALRAHALSLPAVAYTSGTLGATSAGFSRSDGGSFLTDGFADGMEIICAGFTQTTPALAQHVAATLITVVGGRTVEAAAPGRTLTVAFPSAVAWEGEDFSPSADRWYADEDYVPGGTTRKTLGPGGQMETTPSYYLNLYSPPNYGVLAPYALADALVAHFAPDTVFVLASGDPLRVRGDVAPYRGQLTVREGYAVIPVTVPLTLRTANTI